MAHVRHEKKNTALYAGSLLSVFFAFSGFSALVFFFDEMIPFVAVNVVFFAFYFISLPLAQDRVASLGRGADSNLVMGSFNAIKSFGSIFGSALAGFIYEMGAKLPFVFGFAAFAAATGMMLLFCKEEKKTAKA